MHEVGRYSTRAVAELHRALLEEHGIEAFVASDDCGGMWTGLTSVQGARLLVADTELEQAKLILADNPAQD
ncbi:MAG: DUF2007 domain-containing protein [Planctomycetota bacterium]|nr:DUF2007 domain-containing protein [Planctomycetota bacterium]